MSGYGGVDDESKHAMILAENGIHAVRQMLYDDTFVFNDCRDCGDEIPKARVRALPGVFRCVACQTEFEKTFRAPKIKMLDRIL